MKVRQRKNQQGFTIIEVVLVLAIAGLIFLMVFVALPAFQRAQRNLRRKEDIDRFLSAIIDYQGNNRGRLPDDYDEYGIYINHYIDDEADLEFGWDPDVEAESCSEQFRDPDGECYNMNFGQYNYWNGYPVSIPSVIARTENTILPKVILARNSEDYDRALMEEYQVFNHTIYVSYHSSCGPEENTYYEEDELNKVAMFYVLEGGQVYCADNS